MYFATCFVILSGHAPPCSTNKNSVRYVGVYCREELSKLAKQWTELLIAE